jgi:hypothetical protein
MSAPHESMREMVGEAAGGYEIYHARRTEYETDEVVPFRTSPEPLTLSAEEGAEINRVGEAVAAFHEAVDELYQTDEKVRELLDRGKPEIFLGSPERGNYLFVRPDIIMTDQGFTICELETSPFGLALADILNKSYRQAGFETMVGDTILEEHVHTGTPNNGRIVYSAKTAAYNGQLSYLAEEVFSGDDRQWSSEHIETIDHSANDPMYRAFYTSEYEHDSAVQSVLERVDENQLIIPSITPALEEKAVMGLLWDKRWETYFARQLGSTTVDFLRRVIPPTLIVGEEAHFAPGLPAGIADVAGLASLAKGQRTLVLKPSSSSWAEGLHFLHKNSRGKAVELLRDAVESPKLHIIQEFRPGRKIPFTYEEGYERRPMTAKVRLTPYFGTTDGKLIAVKATACENTDRIHGSSSSINTAVARGK